MSKKSQQKKLLKDLAYLENKRNSYVSLNVDFLFNSKLVQYLDNRINSIKERLSKLI